MKKKLWILVLGICLIVGLSVSVVCLQKAKTKAEAAPGDAISADITVVKYRSAAGIMQYRRWNETKGAWVDEEWVDFTETPKPTLAANETGKVPTPKPTPTSVPEPTAVPTLTPILLSGTMPEQKVMQADAAADKVLVDEAHFSDDVFREYLLKTYDTDEDGYLSKAEREQLTELRYYDSDTGNPFTKYAWLLWKVQTFDGLDWFPNLEKISILGSYANVFLKNHPSIRHVGNAEGGMSIWAENCEKLESIGFGGESYGGTVFVKDCKNFKSFWVNDSDFSALYFSGTPNLVLTGDFLTCDTSADVSLDTSVTLVFTGGGGCRLDENGKPFFRETKITWLGEEQFSKDLEKDFDRMRAMHEEAVRQAKVEEISVNKRRMDLYFSHIGREHEGTPGASNKASFCPDDVPKYAAENFSLEKRFETEGTVCSVWYSAGRTSIFTCATWMDVYYTDDGKKEKIEGCSVGAVHYFVLEPDGTLAMYESSREAFEAIGLADVYQYYFSHKYLIDD